MPLSQGYTENQPSARDAALTSSKSVSNGGHSHAAIGNQHFLQFKYRSSKLL